MQPILRTIQSLSGHDLEAFLNDPKAMTECDGTHPPEAHALSREEMVTYLMSTHANLRKIDVALAGASSSLGSIVDILSDEKNPLGGFLSGIL